MGGEAAARAATKVANKVKAIVAHQLEAAPEDIELRDGKFSVRGSPDKGMTLAEVAGAAYVTMDMPEGMEPGLDEQSFYDPENFVFPFGAHACVVDIDGETGKTKIVRYVAVDDCGPAINPLLIDGQVHGGITHGVGQALYERIHYDESGQLVTGTFVDYALPTAAELPSYETDRTETPSPVNSLGVKGVGEAGTIAGSAAVTNAVLDALRPLGVDFINMPLVPDAYLGSDSGSQGRCAGMIPAEFDYTAPDTLEGAIQAVTDGGEDAKLLAGGHSLLPLMKLRLAAPSLLVDLRKVPGLHGIQRENGTWRIGALTPHAALEHTPDLGIVSKTAGTIADPQVRNRGTIGGSLAHGDPASDLPAVMLICEASVTLQGRRRQSAERRRERPVPQLPRDRDRAGRGPHRGANAGIRRLGLQLPEVQPAERGLGDGRRQRARQADRRRVRGRPRRADEHGVGSVARRGGRGRSPGTAVEQGQHRQGGRAGSGGHRPARRPQRKRGVQAPPGARAHPPRPRRGSGAAMMAV